MLWHRTVSGRHTKKRNNRRIMRECVGGVMAEPRFTPDGRYLIVRGRLWRTSNPHLEPSHRERLVHALMAARRAVAAARRSDDAVALKEARAQVDAAKHQLGERGTVWWSDGAPDLNRHMVHTTQYAAWYASLP